MKIIDFKTKKKMYLLTNKLQKYYESASFCYIYGENFEDKFAKDEKYLKIRNH